MNNNTKQQTWKIEIWDDRRREKNNINFWSLTTQRGQKKKSLDKRVYQKGNQFWLKKSNTLPPFKTEKNKNNNKKNKKKQARAYNKKNKNGLARGWRAPTPSAKDFISYSDWRTISARIFSPLQTRWMTSALFLSCAQAKPITFRSIGHWSTFFFLSPPSSPYTQKKTIFF